MRTLIALLLSLAAAAAMAQPYVPATDAEVLERLPAAPGDPAAREARALRRQLTAAPGDFAIALRVAARYVELGRSSGDPRYAGYAQAALAPWWNEAEPPSPVLLLRATLRQRMHDFDAALADLDRLLAREPRNVQARLTKATVLQVRGQFESARRECGLLRLSAPDLVASMCAAGAEALAGRLAESYAALRASLERNAEAAPALRAWVLGALGEMAARAGDDARADRHLRDALALDPADQYLLGARADFLLERGRAREASALLRESTRADGLLLRHALALTALGSADAAGAVAELRARFEASRARGDRVHLREEARFALHLLGEARTALRLAQENWTVQKEPADLRILLEAAVAAGDRAALAAAREWIAATGFQDAGIARLLRANPN